MAVSYGYDPDKNITSMTNINSEGTSISENYYNYDNNGNIISKIENGQATTYTYDELSRLLSENGIKYSYDNAGNRMTKEDGSIITTYTYDSRNRMTESITAGALRTFEYDNNGSLLESSDGDIYSYDGLNRLVEKVNSDQSWQHNMYGPDGLRMGIMENGKFTGFTNDQGQVVEGISPNWSFDPYTNIHHVWNIVKIDNKYYQVDVDRDDTSSTSHREYFNKTDEDFDSFKYLWCKERYPKCE